MLLASILQDQVCHYGGSIARRQISMHEFCVRQLGCGVAGSFPRQGSCYKLCSEESQTNRDGSKLRPSLSAELERTMTWPLLIAFIDLTHV